VTIDEAGRKWSCGRGGAQRVLDDDDGILSKI
jgi:hypothetical protein